MNQPGARAITEMSAAALHYPVNDVGRNPNHVTIARSNGPQSCQASNPPDVLLLLQQAGDLLVAELFRPGERRRPRRIVRQTARRPALEQQRDHLALSELRRPR